MSRLDDLRGRYFADADDANQPITTHTDDLEVELILDGDLYFTELFEAIDLTTAGDQILLLGWTFASTMTKFPRGEVGDLLAEKQHSGVDVYVVLNGTLYLNRVRGVIPFADNLDSLWDLRLERIPSDADSPPLDQQVLFDFSGAAFGSHHQKVAVIRRGGDTVAYVGGIDLWPDRDDTSDHPGTVLTKDGTPWGWHDAVIRLRGGPVADVWTNFGSRWEEARTLPPRQSYLIRPGELVPWLPFNPAPGAPAPVRPLAFTAAVRTPAVAVQVLRSRYPRKLVRDLVPVPQQLPTTVAIGRPWELAPFGPFRQIYATLKKAIEGAERYIYIEDQFIRDMPAGNREYSLMPSLLTAARAGRKIVLLSTAEGRADGPVKNPAPNAYDGELLAELLDDEKSNVAVWQLADSMVHSKLIFIDDVFCAVGSANLQSRSMYGVDQELHVAVVDAAEQTGVPAGVVRDWRVRVWAEHLEIGGDFAAVRPQLEDLDLALGMWREGWRVGGSPGMWFSGNNPPGFAPVKIRRSFVGPPPIEG